nr:MAG TPA: Protein of unknown function (DUF2802) [Caudoviricetes sp.]
MKCNKQTIERAETLKKKGVTNIDIAKACNITDYIEV